LENMSNADSSLALKRRVFSERFITMILFGLIIEVRLRERK